MMFASARPLRVRGCRWCRLRSHPPTQLKVGQFHSLEFDSPPTKVKKECPCVMRCACSKIVDVDVKAPGNVPRRFVSLASRGERNDQGYEKLALLRHRSPMTPHFTTEQKELIFRLRSCRATHSMPMNSN